MTSRQEPPFLPGKTYHPSTSAPEQWVLPPDVSPGRSGEGGLSKPGSVSGSPKTVKISNLDFFLDLDPWDPKTGISLPIGWLVSWKTRQSTWGS